MGMQNIKTVALENGLCQIGSEDVDEYPQANPESRVQRKLEHYLNDGDDFLERILTEDETWLHHFEPKMKRKSMEWHHANPPYSSDLAPCDHLFSKQKEFLRETSFEDMTLS